MHTRRRLTIHAANKLISSIVCDANNNFVAAGIENPDDGPHESPVYVWYGNPCSNTIVLFLTSFEGPAQCISASTLLPRISHRHSHIAPAASNTSYVTPVLQHRWPGKHLRHISGRRRGRLIPSHQPWVRSCTCRFHVSKHRHLRTWH